MNRASRSTFPSILKRDLTEQVDAIVHAGTLKGAAAAGTIPIKHLTRMLLRRPRRRTRPPTSSRSGSRRTKTRRRMTARRPLATAIERLETYLREVSA